MCIPEFFGGIPIVQATLHEPSFEAPEAPWGYLLIGVDPAQGPDRTVATPFTPEQLEQIARNTAHGISFPGPDGDERSAEPWKLDERARFMEPFPPGAEQFADASADTDPMAGIGLWEDRRAKVYAELAAGVDPTVEQGLWGVRCSGEGTEVCLERFDEETDPPMPEAKTATELLEEAAETLRARGASRDLGEERSMARCIDAFNTLTRRDLTELEGWLFMVVLKLARVTAGRPQLDDCVDIAGYAALAGELLTQGEPR